MRIVLLAAIWFLGFAGALAEGSGALAKQDKPQAGTSQPDPKAFLGTWRATFKGDVFAVLNLKEEYGRLGGTLNNFDIHVDKEGNLDEGTHKDDGDAPLLDVHFKSGALYFVVLEKDQYRDGTSWKFTPLNAHEAELTPVFDDQVNLSPGTVIKPIRIVRDSAKR